MKYKRTIIAVTALTTLTTAGLVSAASNSNNPPLPTETVKTAATNPQPTVTEEVTPVQETQPAIVATPDGKPAIQQVAVQPDYGEDTNNPGTFIVFDKQAVMTAAGIPADQQVIAQQVFAIINPQWIYKKINGVPYFFNMCAEPRPEKMATFGADYDTNPVTQLQWCNNMVQNKWGGWQAAYEHATVSQSII